MSDLGPHPWKASILPTELSPQLPSSALLYLMGKLIDQLGLAKIQKDSLETTSTI